MALRGTAVGIASPASTVTVTVSGIGIQSGDVVILAVICGGGGSLTPSFPTGFTTSTFSNIDVSNGTQQTYAIAWKVAGSSEPSSYTITPGSTDYHCATCRVYSGRAGGSSPFTATATTGSTNWSTPASLSATGVTAAAGDDVCVIYGINGTAVSATYTPSAPTGFSNLVSETSSSAYQPLIFGCDDVNVSAGATGSIVASLTSTGNSGTAFGAYVMAITQSSGGGTTENLSGQTGTFTEGTVTRALAYSASGQTATFSEGAVGASISYTLGSQTITSSQGAITGSVAYSASSQTATFTEGTISASTGGNVTLSLSGQTSSFSLGSVTEKTTYSVGAQTATFSSNAIAMTAIYSLLGETATFSEGTISLPAAPSAITWTFDQEFTFDSVSYTWDGYYPQSSPTSYIAILGVAVFNVSAASAISQFEIFIGYAPFAVTGESISAALQGGSAAPNVMPNLVGLELYPAIALLQQLNIYVPAKIGYFGTFPIKAVFVKSNLPPSTVTAQSLAEGLAAPPNTLITLTVSEFTVSVAFP